jgi:hypothetical protein
MYNVLLYRTIKSNTYVRDDEKNMCEPLLIPLFCGVAIPLNNLS